MKRETKRNYYVMGYIRNDKDEYARIYIAKSCRTIARILTEARNQGYNTLTLARGIGISRNMLYLIRVGKYVPHPLTLISACRFLKKPIEFFDTDQPIEAGQPQPQQ